MTMDKRFELLLPVTDAWAAAIAEACGQTVPSPEGTYVNGDLLLAASYLNSAYNHFVVASDYLNRVQPDLDMKEMTETALTDMQCMIRRMYDILRRSCVMEE